MEKLIRDNIVDYVNKKEGKILNTRIASEAEFLTLLKNKVVEEALEVQSAENKEQLAEELADLLEVIRAICKNQEIVDSMFSKRETKYLEKGGFSNRVVLIK